jgi:hypothetical protein
MASQPGRPRLESSSLHLAYRMLTNAWKSRWKARYSEAKLTQIADVLSTVHSGQHSTKTSTGCGRGERDGGQGC